MLHYSCDMCGKSLMPNEQSRYIVRIEVYTATETTELTADDLDTDHLEEMSEYLAELEEQCDDLTELPESPKKMRFDLCPTCHGKFLKDPFSRENAQKLNFSKN